MKHNLHVSGEESPVFRHGEYVKHGANAVKSFLGEKAVLVFIKRDKSAIIESLLERVRQGNSEGVVSRILNLDQETRNESYCDWVIDNNQEPKLTAKQLLQIL